MTIITVDGNIGCGKSSVLEYIHTKYGCAVDLEPIRKWEPFLNELYATGKNAFEFQVRVWLDRCWIQQRSLSSCLIMERSPYFQSKAFIPMNYLENRIGESELKLLEDMYELSMNTWVPDLYIYLASNPDACIERIHRRNRGCEQGISLSYIERLHAYHEKAFVDAKEKGVSIFRINVEGQTIPEIGDQIYQVVQSHSSGGAFNRV